MCFTSNYIWISNRVSHKAVVKKLETSQRAMEMRMLNVKLKDRIRHTTIRQRTRVTDIVQSVANAKWKWAGHIARMKYNRWTVRSTEWQIKGARSVARPKRSWRDDMKQRRAAWTRTEKDGGLRQRKTSCSGRTQPRIEKNKIVWCRFHGT